MQSNAFAVFLSGEGFWYLFYKACLSNVSILLCGKIFKNSKVIMIAKNLLVSDWPL